MFDVHFINVLSNSRRSTIKIPKTRLYRKSTWEFVANSVCCVTIPCTKPTPGMCLMSKPALWRPSSTSIIDLAVGRETRYTWHRPMVELHGRKPSLWSAIPGKKQWRGRVKLTHGSEILGPSLASLAQLLIHSSASPIGARDSISGGVGFPRESIHSRPASGRWILSRRPAGTPDLDASGMGMRHTAGWGTSSAMLVPPLGCVARHASIDADCFLEERREWRVDISIG